MRVAGIGHSVLCIMMNSLRLCQGALLKSSDIIQCLLTLPFKLENLNVCVCVIIFTSRHMHFRFQCMVCWRGGKTALSFVTALKSNDIPWQPFQPLVLILFDLTSNIYAHSNSMHTSDLKFNMCASDPSGPYMAQSF